MSRGHGWLERAIIDVLPETTPCTAERIRQSLVPSWRKGTDKNDTERKRILLSLRTSINRALRALERDGTVKRATLEIDGVRFPAWRRATLAKRRREIAFHEAGHAVIGHVLKRGVQFVTIEPQGSTLGRVNRSTGHRIDDPAEINVSMAGEIAEAEFSGRAIDWRRDGCRADVRLIRFSMRCSSGLDDSANSWASFEAKTQVLVRKHWPAIRAMADQLLRQKTLLRSDIADVCTTNGSHFEK
jgi:Peptidase family M41